MAIRSLDELSSALARDTNLQNQFKTDPVQAIQTVAGQAAIPDTLVYRIVISTLGAAVLLVVIGGFILVAKFGKDIPPALVSIGSASVGALTGLLAPSPVSK